MVTTNTATASTRPLAQLAENLALPLLSPVANGLLPNRISNQMEQHRIGRPALAKYHTVRALCPFQGGKPHSFCGQWQFSCMPVQTAAHTSPALALSLFKNTPGKRDWLANCAGAAPRPRAAQKKMAHAEHSASHAVMQHATYTARRLHCTPPILHHWALGFQASGTQARSAR